MFRVRNELALVSWKALTSLTNLSIFTSQYTSMKTVGVKAVDETFKVIVLVFKRITF